VHHDGHWQHRLLIIVWYYNYYYKCRYHNFELDSYGHVPIASARPILARWDRALEAMVGAIRGYRTSSALFRRRIACGRRRTGRRGCPLRPSKPRAESSYGVPGPVTYSGRVPPAPPCLRNARTIWAVSVVDSVSELRRPLASASQAVPLRRHSYSSILRRTISLVVCRPRATRKIPKLTSVRPSAFLHTPSAGAGPPRLVVEPLLSHPLPPFPSMWPASISGASLPESVVITVFLTSSFPPMGTYALKSPNEVIVRENTSTQREEWRRLDELLQLFAPGFGLSCVDSGKA
jgi:hypothetical protein